MADKTRKRLQRLPQKLLLKHCHTKAETCRIQINAFTLSCESVKCQTVCSLLQKRRCLIVRLALVPPDIYTFFSLSLSLQISEGLSFLHSGVKMVHGNLCLENIILNKSGAWKIMGFDFSISSTNPSDAEVCRERIFVPEYSLDRQDFTALKTQGFHSYVLVSSSA